MTVKIIETRSQEMNKRIALDVLQKIADDALTVVKERQETKPTYVSKERRLEGKKIKSEKKKTRREKIEF